MAHICQHVAGMYGRCRQICHDHGVYGIYDLYMMSFLLETVHVNIILGLK